MPFSLRERAYLLLNRVQYVGLTVQHECCTCAVVSMNLTVNRIATIWDDVILSLS